MRKRNFNLKAVSFDIRDFIVFIKTHSSIIMLFSLFACGLIIGTVTVKNSEYCRYLLSVFVTEDVESMRIFINGIFAIFLVLTVNFIMGLCLVGLPFICFTSVFEGMYISSLYSYQLYLYGYEKIGRYLLTDVLFFVLLYVLFIYSQYTAICMSDSLKRYYSNHKGAVNLRNYLIKFAVFFVVSLLTVVMKVFVNILI